MRVSDHPAAAAGPDHRVPRAETKKLPSIVSVRLAYLEAEIDLTQGQLATIQSRLKAIRDGGPADAQATETAAALTARRTETTGRYDALCALRNAANLFLEQVKRSRSPVEEVRPKIKLPTMPNAFSDAIMEARLEITRAKAELAEVRKAPVTVDNLQGQIRQQVLALAAKGRPSSAGVTSDGRVNIIFGDGGYLPSSVELAAWLHPDAMVARLVAEVGERQSHRGGAMTADEKQERLQSLKVMLDRLERKDAYLTGVAIDRGRTDIAFRPDTEVSAFLGIKANMQIMGVNPLRSLEM